MAKISLRSYIQDIERQVESGRTEEAMAHCRYILQSYPRYIDVYRLLGKALLESQRYGDAADIFQRVLSSLPEDFVSHVGMSIIREDEGNLDESIWHMERAFEVQPSNGAIQDELRRLYGRRDSVEPPKIRLTRGALARMYHNGDLYTQAIAEIRAALAEDKNRLDLLVLLASVYAKAGQRVEAAQAAGNVLRKLPNCMEANRIMAEILVGTDREPEAQAYRQRLNVLEPYYTQVSASMLSPDRVPDQALSIEKLSWKPGQAAPGMSGQPTWAASLGIDLDDSADKKEALPEWLTGLPRETQTGKGTPALQAPATAAFSFDADEEEASPDFMSGLTSESPASGTAEDQIPDWMKSAGWESGTEEGEAQEASFHFDEAELPPQEDQLAQAEIPEWLRAMAPSEKPPTDQQESDDSGGEEDVAPWLDKILPEDAASAAAGLAGQEIPDWLQSEQASGTPAAEQPASGAPGEIPDWLTGAASPDNQAADELPDWLAGEQTEDTVSELPDWLMGEEPTTEAAEPTAEAAQELPDWLTGAEPAVEAAEPAAEVEPSEEMPAWLVEEPAAEAAQELPDWLMGEETTAEAAEPAAEGEPPEGLPAWLMEEEPAAKAEAETVEPAAEIEPSEELPAWLVEEPAAEAAQELPDWLMGEKTAVEAAEPIAKVEPSEGLPAWLAEEETAAEAAQELPDWLMGEETTAEAAEPTAEGEPSEGLPAWLMEEEPAAKAEAETVEPAAEIEPSEELPAWLVEEEPAAEAAQELPDWLMGEKTAVEAAEPIAKVEPSEGLPAWLA
ncbi:MAG: tetratricopeptide repeat protein, partial [Chloroflexota bacterium]